MQIGNFIQDEFGLWHHKQRAMGSIFDAIDNARTSRQKNMFVCFFWWNGTFTPMAHHDTSESLYQRWSEWREKYQVAPSDLLVCLEKLTPG